MKNISSIEYHPVNMDDIINYFVQGYGDNVRIAGWYYDCNQKKAILKLYVIEDKEDE